MNYEFGEYITELRLTHGYSQRYLAELLEIGRQAYSHYETGRNMPMYRSIVRMAELYEVSTETFLDKMYLSESQWKELDACYRIMMEHKKQTNPSRTMKD